jgi:hypothetical protein
MEAKFRPDYPHRDRILADVRHVCMEQDKMPLGTSNDWHMRSLVNMGAIAGQILKIKSNKRWTLGHRTNQLEILRDQLVVLAGTIVGWVEHTDRMIAQEQVKPSASTREYEVPRD